MDFSVAFQNDILKHTRRCLLELKHLALPQFILKAFLFLFLFFPYSFDLERIFLILSLSLKSEKQCIFTVRESEGNYTLFTCWKENSASRSWEFFETMGTLLSGEKKEKMMWGSNWNKLWQNMCPGKYLTPEFNAENFQPAQQKMEFLSQLQKID